MLGSQSFIKKKKQDSTKHTQTQREKTVIHSFLSSQVNPKIDVQQYTKKNSMLKRIYI